MTCNEERKRVFVGLEWRARSLLSVRMSFVVKVLLGTVSVSGASGPFAGGMKNDYEESGWGGFGGNRVRAP